jgi:hypothetical protein
MFEFSWQPNGGGTGRSYSKKSLEVVLTASFVSQFFSQEFVENETSFSRKCHCQGKMRYIVKLASLANLKLLLIIAILATKFLFARLVRKESLQNLSARLARSKSCYKISVCDTCRSDSPYKLFLRDSREVILATKFLSVRLARSESRY